VRVLVVEDDAAVRETLCDLLVASGHVTGVAVDHASALLLLDEAEWDVVLADLMLPGGSGLDLAERALAAGVGAVLCTGHPQQMDHILQPGIGHLIKPFSAGQLEAALTQAGAAAASARVSVSGGGVG
jgi:DNA-binding response OmpR family regulator